MINKKRAVLTAWILIILLSFAGCGSSGRVKETDDITHGIDVARYQGTIDWEEVAASDSVDFVMVRIGYRGMEDGIITEDGNARYNLQEASANQIMMGAYFFSTAISEAEAVEEANYVADILDLYSITYPVAYDCENFNEPNSRQYGMSKSRRTDIALAFLDAIEKRGYEGMFYASKNQMTEDAQWEVSRIQEDYKVWVAQYPEIPYPETEASTYEGEHKMWQYSMEGSVEGIDQPVDLNVAYFGYKEIAEPISEELPGIAYPDPEALMTFKEVNEEVTAKIETNLRRAPSQGEDGQILYTLRNGEIATRIGISDSGWSKVIFNGNIYYTLTNNLTRDTEYIHINTVFEPMDDKVTAKIEVNLRNIPSVEDEDSQVIAVLKHGDVALRTGINRDVGWSRVNYNGEVLYCITSYLENVK